MWSARGFFVKAAIAGVLLGGNVRAAFPAETLTADSACRAIEAAVAASDADLARRQAALTDVCSLAAYRAAVARVNGTNVWTAALQAALRDHEVVRIPASDETYWIDATVVMPSNRRIEAEAEEGRKGSSMYCVKGECEKSFFGSLRRA